MRLMIDAHLDLAWCALSFNRDLTRSVAEIRQSEIGLSDDSARGRNTLSLPEMRKAKVAVCIGTLLARSGPDRPKQAPLHRISLDYATQTIAGAVAMGQLAYYELLARQGEIVILRSARQLDDHWRLWNKPGDTSRLPIGVLLSMEGADPVLAPDDLQRWFDLGLRAIEPAHYGRSQYAHGTSTDGPLSPMGEKLIAEMSRIGVALDVTHLSDQSMAHALDLYQGPVWASHHNCRALVPGDRQLADDQIKRLIQRDAVIGVALDAWMLYPGFIRHQTPTCVVGMEAVADQIDHVCQIAGSANHSAIGSDLDGGFGNEQTPHDLDTIADLHKLEEILARRKYSPADIDNIFHGNWLRIFRQSLPA